MAIEIKCRCGREYRVKEEHAGKTVKCNHCANKMQVPAAQVMEPGLTPPFDDDDLFAAPKPVLRPPLDDEDLYTPPPRPAKTEAKPSPTVPAVDPVFDRDVFALKTKPKLGMRQRFEVRDEENRLLMVVERPARAGRHVLRLFVIAVVPFFMAIAIIVGIMFFADRAKIPVEDALGLWTFIWVGVFVAAWILVMAIVLSVTRDVFIYRGSGCNETLLEIRQSKKFQVLRSEYTLHLPNGMRLARFQKSILFDLLRQRWHCFRPGGGLLCFAVESPLVIAVFRRIPILSLLYFTPFLIRDARSERMIGRLNRGFLNNCTLDLSDDPERVFDRRILLALAVMLDFGEYRPY
jgi:hypothetical protein